MHGGRDLNDAKMRTSAMELIAAQAILAYHRPTTASPFTGEFVAEGGISTLLKLVNFIILTPQLTDLRRAAPGCSRSPVAGPACAPCRRLP